MGAHPDGAVICRGLVHTLLAGLSLDYHHSILLVDRLEGGQVPEMAVLKTARSKVPDCCLSLSLVARVAE